MTPIHNQIVEAEVNQNNYEEKLSEEGAQLWVLRQMIRDLRKMKLKVEHEK